LGKNIAWTAHRFLELNMDSYPAEMRSSLEITLQDADGELEPYNESGGGGGGPRRSWRR
jgi:hypothetical protein